METPNNTATLAPESVPQVPEPSAPEPGSTATEPNAQAQTPPQSAPNGQVEPSVQPTPSQSGARPKPSEYVRQRLKIQNLEQTVSNLQRMIEANQARTAVPDKTEQPPEDLSKKVWDDPISVINKVVADAVNKSIETRMTQEKTVSARREALEHIFKNEDISRDGDEGYERIVKILRESGLDILAKTDPDKASKLAVELYKFKYPSVSSPKATTPLAPKKSQMASTQTGNATAPSTQKEVSVDDLVKELKSIKEAIIKNPDLNYDDATKARIAEIKKKISPPAQ